MLGGGRCLKYSLCERLKQLKGTALRKNCTMLMKFKISFIKQSCFQSEPGPSRAWLPFSLCHLSVTCDAIIGHHVFSRGCTNGYPSNLRLSASWNVKINTPFALNKVSSFGYFIVIMGNRLRQSLFQVTPEGVINLSDHIIWSRNQLGCQLRSVGDAVKQAPWMCDNLDLHT